MNNVDHFSHDGAESDAVGFSFRAFFLKESLTLKDCPKENEECGLDELQDVTADKIFERERKNNRATFDNESEVNLKNFKIPASKFTLGEFERYLINTGTGVVKVEFSIPKKLAPEFVSEFLNRLEP